MPVTKNNKNPKPRSACDRCRKSKIKCSKSQPACHKCCLKRETCTYPNTGSESLPILQSMGSTQWALPQPSWNWAELATTTAQTDSVTQTDNMSSLVGYIDQDLLWKDRSSVLWSAATSDSQQHPHRPDFPHDRTVVLSGKAICHGPCEIRDSWTSFRNISNGYFDGYDGWPLLSDSATPESGMVSSLWRSDWWQQSVFVKLQGHCSKEAYFSKWQTSTMRWDRRDSLIHIVVHVLFTNASRFLRRKFHSIVVICVRSRFWFTERLNALP